MLSTFKALRITLSLFKSVCQLVCKYTSGPCTRRLALFHHGLPRHPDRFDAGRQLARVIEGGAVFNSFVEQHQIGNHAGGDDPTILKAKTPRSEEHTSELQSHSDLHSFPTTTLFRSSGHRRWRGLQ